MHSPSCVSGGLLFLALLVACGDNLEPEVPPDACARTVFYADVDGDGHGDPDSTRTACARPDGYTGTNDDCADADADVFPTATEVCGNGRDEDCSGGDALCSTERDGWTITSHPVVQGTTSATITATITFTKLSGTAGTRGGGACLVADLVDRGIGAATCTTDTDCIAAAQAVFPSPEGYGYCASPDGSGEPKRCWTRPSNNCHRSATNPPGDKTLTEVTWDVSGAHTPVRWMLLGCLAEEATPGGCGTGDPTKYVRSLGPAITFR